MTELDDQLHQACRAEPVDVASVRALLEAGADARVAARNPHILHGDVMSALHCLGLCRANPIEAAGLLLEAGAELEARSERRQWTPLHLACVWNHLPLARLLVERGAVVDVHGAGYSPDTPLVACINANAELCLPTLALLLAAGADPNFRADEGESPLEKAVSATNLPAVRALLEAGADPNQVGTKEPCLHRALSSRNGGAIAEVLLEAGVDVDQRGAGGRAAVHEAVLRTETEHLELLLRFGADLDARDDKGRTPLMAWLTWLARETPQAVVEGLLAHGVDPNARDDDGTPTLHLALRKGEAAVVKTLVAGGAAVDQRDASGQSAVELARELNPLLVTALGVGDVSELAPPTELALQGLRAGMHLQCASGTLRADAFEPERGRPQPLNEALIREQLAWSLVENHDDAGAITELINAVATELGHGPRDTATIVGELRAREPELVARCELELRPEHAGQIIEAAVRVGYVPCRHDKEGYWTWRYVGGPEDQAFVFNEAGDDRPAAERRTSGAQLRSFFANFEPELGRLHHWQRHRLDAALATLGLASERLWLAAQAERSSS